MPQDVMPFDEFYQDLKKKKLRSALKGLTTRTASESSAELMRSYLVNYYRQMSAVKSFADSDGIIWDFIPVQSQPSLRGSHNPMPLETPDFSFMEAKDDQLNDNKRNVFSTDDTCPEGYIPLRRLALEELAGFSSLQTYLTRNKEKIQATRGTKAIVKKTGGIRKYIASRETVINRGGGGVFNVWQPHIHPPNQFMSLAQIWMAAGLHTTIQTVECGWQVALPLTKTTKPVLFIYWTPDAYQSGSYNLEKPGTFVQKNPNFKLGGAFNDISTVDGPMVEIDISWIFSNNSWWLVINGKTVGYYPGPIFKGGALLHGAEEITLGGEVNGNGTWPAMGSGWYADAGIGKAATVRHCRYVDVQGQLFKMKLDPIVSSAGCYNFKDASSDGWGSAFFYGGPGGNNC